MQLNINKIKKKDKDWEKNIDGSYISWTYSAMKSVCMNASFYPHLEQNNTIVSVLVSCIGYWT
jgi:hypothetical protein